MSPSGLACHPSAVKERKKERKYKDIIIFTLVPELNHMAKDSMILRDGYCSCYRVDKLECSSI